jgi:[ribosomal protein S5]-alanine N-acetyltransferase
MNVQLQTERLRLPPLTRADAEALWPVVSDERVARWMSWDPHRSIEETVAFLEATEESDASGASYRWGIWTREDELAGVVSVEEIVRTFRAWKLDTAELAYIVGPRHQGRGYATEAAREALRFAFEDLGLHKVLVNCFTENQASREVIAKLGCRLIGEQRQHIHRYNRWWDHLNHELLAADWRTLNPPPAPGAALRTGSPSAGR